MLIVNHRTLQKMKTHAGQAYPEECCGMLLGKDDNRGRTVFDVIAMRNERGESRERRFLITPEEYRRAEEEARRGGVDVIGLYHSHPDHPAQPSRFDLEHAMPWWSYVIVSVQQKLPTSVRSWVLRDDRLGYTEEDIIEGGSTEWPSRS